MITLDIGLIRHHLSCGLRRLLAMVLLVVCPFLSHARVCSTVFSESPFKSEDVEFSRELIDPGLLSGTDAGQKRVPYIHVRSAEGARFSETELFREHADFVIGIDASGNTKGHMYVAMNNVRFDGRMFFAHSTFERSAWTIPPGLLIRYRNVPEEIKARLWDWMNSGETIQAPSCVAATCKLFFDKLDFQGGRHRFWFPDRMIKHLLEEAPLANGGEPLQFEVYAFGKDFSTFWSELPSWRTVPRFFFKVLFDPRTWGRRSHKKPDMNEQTR